VRGAKGAAAVLVPRTRLEGVDGAITAHAEAVLADAAYAVVVDAALEVGIERICGV